METSSDAKIIRLTWHDILSILQKYPKDPLSLTKVMEESIGTGRGITKCTGGRELMLDLHKLYARHGRCDDVINIKFGFQSN